MPKLISKFKVLLSSRYLVRRQRRRFVEAKLLNNFFERVLDLGVGTAPYKKLIKCREYIGIDIEDRRGVEGVILADINNGIPQPNNYFDLVVMFEVLEHIRRPQFVLNEITRILRKNGELVMTVPFVWSLHEVPNDYYRYTYYGLEYMLKQAGFSDIEILPSNNFYYTICQLININLRRKIYYPLVFFINVVGLLIKNMSKNYNLPLSYYVVAKK